MISEEFQKLEEDIQRVTSEVKHELSRVNWKRMSVYAITAYVIYKLFIKK